MTLYDKRQLLKPGDQVALVGCSNGLSKKGEDQLELLKEVLMAMGLEIVVSPFVYSGDLLQVRPAKARGEALMACFKDQGIQGIFDVSGGDLANEVLDYLDFQIIGQNPKPFLGYSDLTPLMNAMTHHTKHPSYWYQIRHLVGSDQAFQQKAFFETWFNGTNTLFQFDYQWIQGESMKGKVMGGNIRCLLKLAGTLYWPNLSGCILFLESLSGDVNKMMTALVQLKHIGVFDEIEGILLGTFTEMEKTHQKPTLQELVKQVVNNPRLPIIKTSALGHDPSSRSIILGEHLILGKC